MRRAVLTRSITQFLTLTPSLTLTLTRRCDLQLVAFFLYHSFRKDRNAAPAVLNVRPLTRPALLLYNSVPFLLR